MELRRIRFEDAVHLTGPMEQEMADLYEVDNAASPTSPDDFEPPYGLFLAGSVDGHDVAGGGIRRLHDGVGEVKRMYVARDHRGRGYARAVLRALVEHARSVSLQEVWLETGIRQPEAMGLYASEGFLPMEAFGHFADDPESRCFRLPLA
jgi:GNAT superfamily N-acetyltransferase